MMEMPDTADALESLRALSEAIAWIAAQKTEFVLDARHQGRSWAEIGDALGMTRQSAYERYGVIANRAMLVTFPDDPDDFDRRAAVMQVVSDAITVHTKRP